MKKNNFSESIINTKETWCDGIFSNSLHNSLGHPKVYLKVNATNEVKCPYCSHRFIYRNKTSEDNG